jgi:hypothetical protein
VGMVAIANLSSERAAATPEPEPEQRTRTID